MSNSGDAAQYTNSDFADTYLPVDTDDTFPKFPWPDSRVANEWMKYIVCPRNDFVGDIYDDNVPSYLAIVTDQYDSSRRRLIDGIIDDLIMVLEDAYGNSSSYPDAFIEEKYSDGTWSIPIIPTTTTTTDGPTMEPTVEPTMEPTQPTTQPTMEPTVNMTTTESMLSTVAETTMYTTNLRRRLLQMDDDEAREAYLLSILDPNCFSESVETQFFPPYPCLEDLTEDGGITFSCWKAARQTNYLNFTEGIVYVMHIIPPHIECKDNDYNYNPY